MIHKLYVRTKFQVFIRFYNLCWERTPIIEAKWSKATGIDDLPQNLLKDCATVIAKPLAHIINLSNKSSTVPALWKSAKVKPIFKSGDSDLVENFRPISILPISKILEKAVHRQFYNFLENNKLLNDCQFGFRRNRSTKLAATLFCDKIRKEMDNGKLIGCVYLDLSWYSFGQITCVWCWRPWTCLVYRLPIQ